MASICVFCASSSSVAQHYVDLAADVGTELARRGHSLVTGAGSVSLMGAVARSARAGGARTVGVIPRALRDLEIADTDSDELVVVADMRTRKGEMDRRCNAFVTLPGGLGTLEELAEVWVARTLAMHTKPVVILDPDDAWAPLRAQVDQLVDRGFARPSVRDAVAWAATAAQALDLVEAGLAAVPTLPPPQPEETLEAEP